MSSPKQSTGISRAYLFLFNGVSCSLWAAVIVMTIKHFLDEQPALTLYASVGSIVAIAQALAFFEVIHSVIGIVKSPVTTVALQVASRFLVLYGIVQQVSTTQTSWFIVSLISAWSLVEVPRYMYYAVNLFSNVPYPLLYLRYSMFIVLYPIGIASELMCMYQAIPFFKKTGQWSFSMPNNMNFEFSFYAFLLVAAVSYIPGSPFLYTHMLNQRSKYLFPERSESKPSSLASVDNTQSTIPPSRRRKVD